MSWLTVGSVVLVYFANLHVTSLSTLGNGVLTRRKGASNTVRL